MTEAAHKLNVSEDVLTWNAHGKTVTVHCFANTQRAGTYIADAIADSLRQAIDARTKAVWIGCGGTTPKPIYQHLIHAELDWSKVTLAQVDERFVPVDDAASNTRMMREALAPVLADKDHSGMAFLTLIQDIDDQAACAEKAEKTLRDLSGGEAPRFDFALMGMGPDTHYASIFPHNPINAEVYTTERLVMPVQPHTDGTEPKLPRITLSVPAINNSRRILFYITGQAKLDALRASTEDTDPYTSPIGAFIAQCPTDVEFVWAS